MAKTGESFHVMDKMLLMQVYSNIVSDLYNEAKFAKLPAVQSDTVTFMAEVFERPSTKALPLSTPRTWQDISEHQDGKEAMAVINSMIVVA